MSPKLKGSTSTELGKTTSFFQLIKKKLMKTPATKNKNQTEKKVKKVTRPKFFAKDFQNKVYRFDLY